MTLDKKRSPLGHRNSLGDANGRIAIAEAPFLAMVQVRGTPDDVANAVRDVTDLELPDTAGTCARSGETSVIWLSPDEWVIIGAPHGEHAIVDGLSAALGNHHAQVVNVSDYFTTIRLAGPGARDVLAKIVMHDLHPRAFSKGHAIATLLGHAGGWLEMTDDETGGGPAFQIYVRRSMADYLWCLLADGGREFGLPLQEPIGREKLHLPHFEGA
ncbi:MAG: sarcosine oxidase subunit gamma family protein [Pseudomonadota bacterium]